jgi:hypothetical protein
MAALAGIKQRRVEKTLGKGKGRSCYAACCAAGRRQDRRVVAGRVGNGMYGEISLRFGCKHT